MDAHATEVDACAAPGLISLDEACRIARSCAECLHSSEAVSIEEAQGRFLAEAVLARLALPPFDQSAMDGFAVRALDVAAGSKTLSVAARVGAGDRPVSAAEREAVRIFTGAPMPTGCDTVIMQEHVVRSGDTIRVEGSVRRGSNIRVKGEDCAPGDPLLGVGRRLDARALALLAAQGFERVAVCRRPKVALLSTGNELRPPGAPLDASSVYDSNRIMLAALVFQAGAEVIDLGWIGDEPAAIARAISSAAALADLVVTTGGASAGEEDHASAALSQAGAAFSVLRIAMKPGKPALVGRIGRCACLGLPGSPNAALAGWLTLGRAMLASMNGRSFEFEPPLCLPLAHPHERRSGRRELVPATLQTHQGRSRLTLITKAGSARLLPLAKADGLVDFPPEAERFEEGAQVGFHPFADGFWAG